MTYIIVFLGGNEELQINYKDKLIEILEESGYKVGSSSYCANIKPKCDYFILYNTDDQVFDLTDNYQCNFVVFNNYEHNLLEEFRFNILLEINNPNIEDNIEKIFDKLI